MERYELDLGRLLGGARVMLLALLACSACNRVPEGEETGGADSGAVDSPVLDTSDSGDSADSTPPHTGDSRPPDSGDSADSGELDLWEAPDEPIVLFWTIDTLGQFAAEEEDVCGLMQAAFGAYGLDVACRSGGVASSSWTLETHVRLLWPAHNQGAKRNSITPDCGDVSVLVRGAQAYGGTSYLGADNARFEDVGEIADCEGVNTWLQELDGSWLMTDMDLVDQNELPEDERPVRLAMDATLADAAKGGSVFTFLNDYESGGHVPRCFFDPTTESCDWIWSLMVEHGYVGEHDDRYQGFLGNEFWHSLTSITGAGDSLDEEALREAFWGTTVETVAHFWEVRTLERIDALLSSLQAAGRLDDLIIVMTSDHGEAPCADQTLIGTRACTHGSIPSEWVSQVPVYTVPANLADYMERGGYLGPEGRVFSISNLGPGLLDALSVPPDTQWPDPEPPGQATSLTCYQNLTPRQRMGIRVFGEESVRCNDANCGAYTWAQLDGPHAGPEELDFVPVHLAALMEESWSGFTWFSAACQGLVLD